MLGTSERSSFNHLIGFSGLPPHGVNSLSQPFSSLTSERTASGASPPAEGGAQTAEMLPGRLGGEESLRLGN